MATNNNGPESITYPTLQCSIHPSPGERAAWKGTCNLQAKESRKEREAQIAKAQMAQAISGGVSWGMAGDAADDMDEDELPPGGPVDWRAYSQTNTLTDKQQKLATKLRRLENRVMNLSRELERIRVSCGH